MGTSTRHHRTARRPCREIVAASLHALALVSLLFCTAAAADPYAEQRAELLDEVEWDLKTIAGSTGVRGLDPKLRAVLDRVPRHRFVPERYRDHAYDNRPLPIGQGQTISQPLIVALMTALLQLEPEDKVLEIGTGSGYQAAVLSRLVKRVYSIEIVPELGEAAARRLAELGYDNIETRIGDGYYGWPEQAPFDAIIGTAAAGVIPPPLIEQLKPGGRMVIPVGPRYRTQELVVVEKDAAGKVTRRNVLPVAFVPLTGDH
jgi:protein-L-isoaspartate(D-aspartate) O-methyltransferase